ncbi:MAG: LysR family transcriptional regulator substrate-binding protein [Salinisphaera sp.]|nr:LysR family transcriptional regulator substrate-binding protein [Salinisphaera sp.]
MPPVLRRYAASFPQVELEISFMGSEDACRAVRHGQLELAVITLPDCADADLEQCEIWHDPLHVVVARDHPLAHESRVTPASLASHPALLPQPDTVTYGVVAAALAGHGLHPQLRHGSNYLETLKMLTSIGLGWSALPASLVDSDLTVLTLPELSMARSLGSVRHPGRHLSHAAEALLALLGSASEHELAP